MDNNIKVLIHSNLSHSSFRQYRHSGHTHNRPIYSFKVLCLDGPYSSVTPRQARSLRAKNLGKPFLLLVFLAQLRAEACELFDHFCPSSVRL